MQNISKKIIISSFISIMMLITLYPIHAADARRLTSSDLVYKGAFRLPDEFCWGARGMTFYPSGAGGAGSLMITASEALRTPSGEACHEGLSNCAAYFAEVTVPTPSKAAVWTELPQASFIRSPTVFDGGLAATVHPANAFVTGIQYVPRKGTQTRDKIYGSLNEWYPEGDFGDNSFPTIWFSNLDGSNAKGMFHVGPQNNGLYHGRKMGEFLFNVPKWYAEQYLGNRTIVTGRSRGTPAGENPGLTTRGGSQGPALFAFSPWVSDNPSGTLDALPMLYYRVKYPGCAGPDIGAGNTSTNCDYPGFSMCDSWNGGSFIGSQINNAIILLGHKGKTNCYYCDETGADPECHVSPPPAECVRYCHEDRGYHCGPYERQVIFYDTTELGAAAQGTINPWSIVPYEIWRPSVFYLKGGNTCADIGGMAYDFKGKYLFMIERGLGGFQAQNAAVVHVWKVNNLSGTTQNLYFPHIASNTSWETDVCVINTSSSQTMVANLIGYNNTGQQVSSKVVSLAANAKVEYTVGTDFINPGNISYIILESESSSVCGYMKFYIESRYRGAIPATSDINTTDVYIPHIASNANWWTGISLLNTTGSSIALSIEFSNGAIKPLTIAAREHKSFSIKSLFSNVSQPGIKSGIIKNANGIAGLELFGSSGTTDNYLSGLLLKDDTATNLYYPHVAANNAWWTGVVAYNPSLTSSSLTITPFQKNGTALTAQTITLAAKSKYIGTAKTLNFPQNSAWFSITSTQPMTGFELFGTKNGKQLGGYTGVNISRTSGIFPKIETKGWTGIALVNTQNSSTVVNLTAHNNAGSVVAAKNLILNAHEKSLGLASSFFTHNISTASYIAFSSDNAIVGFQLNGSDNNMLLDALPGM